MAIEDFLDFRNLESKENKKCQSELQVSRIGTRRNCLENNKQLFFELTYPSQLIKELIEFINSNMKNNKMRYRDNEGAVIIRGGHGCGKTHALLAAYNLFADYDIASEWLQEHNIKFNKFNGFAIKNKSNSCLISLGTEVEERSWQVVFKSLGKENLLSGGQEPPSSSLIHKLAKSKDTAIFIDDLDQFFHQLKKKNKDKLIKANQNFIADLLAEVVKNDKLMVFIAALGTAQEVKELFSHHEVITKDTTTLAQKNKFIFYHLFDEIKNQQFKANINPVIESYLEKYETTGLTISSSGQFREDLIGDYPFHPELMTVLQQIYQNYFAELKNYKSELNLLADLIGNYQDKDMLVVSDFPVEILKDAVPDLYNGLEAELSRIDDENIYRQRILNTIFLYNVIDNQEATRSNILEGIIDLQLDYESINLEQELDQLIEQGDYLGVDEERYYIKPKKNLDSLLEEQITNISELEMKNRLKEYITNFVFDSNYKFYSDKTWEDKPELDYILLLELPEDFAQLEEFLNQNLYSELNYENSVVVIKATKDIFAAEFFELISKIIAMENIMAQEDFESNQLEAQLRDKKEELKELLHTSFGEYLKWTKQQGQAKLEKVDFSSAEIADVQEKVINKSEIKNYILDIETEVINIAELFEQFKVDRTMPVLTSRKMLEEVIAELCSEQGFVFLAEEDKLYKSLSDLIIERTTEISNTQARNKLITHLRQDLFGADYKIYGIDEIPDQKELQFVVLLNDIVEGDIESFVEEKIYSNRKYKNAILPFKATDNIFEAETIKQVKEELSLEKLVKEWQQREKVIDLLEDKREEVINSLKQSFGSYLSWTSTEEELILEQAKLDIRQFNIDNLIRTKVGFIKEVVIKRINQLETSIKTNQLLEEFKQYRKNPVLDSATFYEIIEELAAENRIYIDHKNEEIYSSFLISIKEEMEQLSVQEVKEFLAYFIKNNLCTAKYKIWGYDEIEDNVELTYLLLLEQMEGNLADFLEQEVYENRKFQNSIVVLRPKEEIYTSQVLSKVRKIIAINNLKEQGEIKASEELLAARKEKLVDLLTTRLAYYEQWINAEQGLKLLEKEVSVTNLETELKVDLKQLKEHIISNLNEREFGISREELFLDYRRFRDYPLLSKREYFDQGLEELIAENKVISIEEKNKVYANLNSLIGDVVSSINNKEAKQKLVLYIRNELFKGKYDVFGYDEVEDSPSVNYLLLLGSFNNKEKLQQILENKLYQNREYKNNIILYSSQEDVFQKKYVNKMKLVMAADRARTMINGFESELENVLAGKKQELDEYLKETFGDYLNWQEQDGELKLTVRAVEAQLDPIDLEAEIKIDLDSLAEDINRRLNDLEVIKVQELLIDYKKFRDHPVLMNEQDFYQALEKLKKEEKVFVKEENQTIHLSPLAKVKENLDKFTTEEAKKEIAALIRDNKFNADYKIFKQDKIEDKLELDYLLLFNPPSENLADFLEKEVYSDLEFQNSIVVLRIKDDIYTADNLTKAKELMSIREMEQELGGENYYKKAKQGLKDELLDAVTINELYHEQWINTKQGLELIEDKISLSELPQNLAADQNKLKEDLINNLQAKEMGISKEELFLEYRKFRGHPMVLDENYFRQVVEKLIADKRIITTKENNKIYGSLDTLIDNRVNQIDDKDVKQELVLYIRNELFNGEYNVFGYDEIKDKAELNYLLLLGGVEDKEKLQQIIERRVYQDHEYKNNIVFYSSRENVFKNKYVSQMKLVMGIEKLQDKIMWEQNELNDILAKKKEELKQNLIKSFGNYIYWQKKDGEWRLEGEELDVKLSTVELKKEIKPDLELLQEDISQRLQELDGMKIEELLAHYYKFRDCLLVVDEQEFQQALAGLEEAGKIFIEEETQIVHISPLLKAEERIDEFETEEAKQKIAYLVRDHFLDEQYKIYGYDQLEDSFKLDYLLLLETPEQELAEFLEQEVYSELDFANSLIILRLKEEIYTAETLFKAKKIMAVKELHEELQGINHEKLTADLKDELLQLVEVSVVYYEQWVSTESGLHLEEKEINISDLPAVLETNCDYLKEHLVTQLRTEKMGVDREKLFLEYRRNREYPLILEKDRFDQIVEELIADNKIIKGQNDNMIYGNTSALIKSTVNKVDDNVAKQELALYIRNELFNGQYNVFGYDQLEDSAEIDYLLLLSSFKNRDKLEEILEKKLYHNRQYQNTIVLYSLQEDVFQEKYVNKMKVVLGIKEAQDKINWSQNKIDRILNKRKEQLREKLEDIFGDYLYWTKEEEELKLEAIEFNTRLTPAELKSEIELDLEKLKADINQRLRNLEGIDSAELLDYYKKFRDYPVVIEENKFYQAIEELKNEKRIVSEKGRLYSNLESLVKAKFDQISTEEAQKRLVGYIKQELFGPDYKIYGFDNIKDDRNLKKVVLLNHWAEKEELIEYLLEEVYQDFKYKGTLAVITPKLDLNEHIELVKKVLAIGEIDTENELVLKLLKVTENKLIKKLQNTFGEYLKLSNSNELELQQQEFELEEIKEIISTDKTAIKEYVMNCREDKIQIAELLEQAKMEVTAPLIVSDDIFYESIRELVIEGQVLLMDSEQNLFREEIEVVTGEMFITDPEFELPKQEDEPEEAKVIDQVEESSADEVAAAEETIANEDDNLETESKETLEEEEPQQEEKESEDEDDNYEILDLFL